MDQQEKPNSKKIKKKTFITELSGEEKAAHYKRLGESAKLRAEQKRALLKQAEVEAEKLLPKMMAERIIEETTGENFNPSIETIQKLRSMVESGLTLSEMRRKFFGSVDAKTWDKLTRFMFKDAIPNPEALGIDIIKVTQERISGLEDRKKDIKKEIKALKKAHRDVPPSLYSLAESIEDKLFRTQIEFQQHLVGALEVVGDKVKAATFNLNFGTPRPKVVNEPIDVTPVVKRALSDMMK